MADRNAVLGPIVEQTAPELIRLTGVGTGCASALRVAAGDNPERLRSEVTFAHLCGTAPVDASTDKNERHRLNRGGDRQANSALWRIVMTRIVYDPHQGIHRTAHGRRPHQEGVLRCVKRYVAREIYNHPPRERLA